MSFRADKKAAKAAAAAAKTAARPPLRDRTFAARARGDEQPLRALNKKLREIEALQLSEAAGETLDEQQQAKLDSLDAVLEEMESLMTG